MSGGERVQCVDFTQLGMTELGELGHNRSRRGAFLVLAGTSLSHQEFFQFPVSCMGECLVEPGSCTELI